jgi:endonuclease/exonuclease/phosphatase family metal-dependent hydrolase
VGMWSDHRYRMRPVPCDPRVAHSVFPIAFDGPEAFHVLAVWAQNLPSYVSAVLAGLNAYSRFIQEAPTVVLGDFNSAPSLQDPDARLAHATLLERLRSDWGLVSAYHHYPETSQAPEMPTYYHRFASTARYHLDYCFVPIQWLPRLSSVSVAGPEQFTSSDHRPLMVELSPLAEARLTSSEAKSHGNR